ncbi:hypothetical protein ACWN9M_05370 [Leuconostoc lactis]
MIKQFYRVVMLGFLWHNLFVNFGYDNILVIVIMYICSQMFLVIDILKDNSDLKKRFDVFQNVIIIVVLFLIVLFVPWIKNGILGLASINVLNPWLKIFFKIVVGLLTTVITLYIIFFIEPQKKTKEEIDGTMMISKLAKRDLRDSQIKKNHSQKEIAKEKLSEKVKTAERKKHHKKKR